MWIFGVFFSFGDNLAYAGAPVIGSVKGPGLYQIICGT
jgi:hypothetical protein